MEISKWQKFLSDNELNANLYLTPNGKYLFGKILHDVLGCLNMYVEWLRLLTELTEPEQRIPQKILNWFDSKIPVVELLLSEIVPFWQYEKELSVESDEWPQLIEQVGMILARGVPYLLHGYEKLEMPTQETSLLLVTAVVSNLRKLQLIWQDIQNEEYKRLWSISKYGTLLGI